MHKVKLGNSGIDVSELCLGTMHFGSKTNRNQSEKLLDLYTDYGGNFIDTSNNYAYWLKGCTGDESETTIGYWLKNKPREKIVIATKCGARPKSNDKTKLEGLSYKAIISSVEKSLRRLQTDYIDLLYGHIDFNEYPIGERIKAFDYLKHSGKIRTVGTSNTSVWRIKESISYCVSHNLISYCCAQQRFSYLKPRSDVDFGIQKIIDTEMLDYARNEKSISLLAYSVLLSGLYSKDNMTDLPYEYSTTDNKKRMEIITETANEISCTKNQLILSWMMHQQTKIIPIISSSKVEQLKENIRSVNIKLSPDLIIKLNIKFPI